MNIDQIIASGESETVEFKASFNDEAIEAIAALANGGGGMVLIGIMNDGRVRGVQLGKKTLEDWANRIQEGTDPRLQPSIQMVEYKGKRIVAIQVEKMIAAPVSVRGRYLRVDKFRSLGPPWHHRQGHVLHIEGADKVPKGQQRGNKGANQSSFDPENA